MGPIPTQGTHTTAALCLDPWLVSAAEGWDFVSQEHHFSRDTCQSALVPVFKRQGTIIQLRSKNTWPCPCGDILTKWGPCWVLPYSATWSSVAKKTLQFTHSFLRKCSNIASEGPCSILGRSAYNLVFPPIDSEKQMANGGLMAFKMQVFHSLSLQHCCLFTWHWGDARCSKKSPKPHLPLIFVYSS